MPESIAKCAKEKNLPITPRFGQNLRNKHQVKKLVIPSEVEGSRGVILKVISRDSSTALRSAQNDAFANKP
jgi:hypothetical protein